MSWMRRLTAWVRGWLDWWNARNQGPSHGLVTCLHPNPPGFTACNRYGYATCLTCKAKVRC